MFKGYEVDRLQILADMENLDTLREEQPGYSPGSGYWIIPPANAYIGYSHRGDGKLKIEIWPEEGGYIECDVDDAGFDVAPFHG
jgi:hypothetical protein